jgi:hypothetical protein
MWRGDSVNSPAWDDFGEDVTWDSLDLRWNDISFTTNSDQINIGYSNGYVEKIDNTSLDDNGTTIDAIWDSKDFQDSQQRIGRWKRMELWATGETVSVYYSINEGSSWVEMSNSPVTLTNEMPQYDSPIILYFDVVASKIRFRFRNNSTTGGLAIKQFVVGYNPREMRR